MSAVGRGRNASRFTSSRSQTKHTYVRVVPRPVVVRLRARLAGVANNSAASILDDATWEPRAQGKVSVRYEPSLRLYAVVMRQEGAGGPDKGTPPVVLPISPHTEFAVHGGAGSGAEDGTILVWLDVASSRQVSLVFPNHAAMLLVFNKVVRAQNIAQHLVDDEARALWFSNFGIDMSVRWTRFAEVWEGMGQATTPAVATDGAVASDQLKAYLVDELSCVSVDTFAAFVEWFGPFAGCLARWQAAAALPYFNPGVSREEAEEILAGHGAQCFLVRLSDPGFFSVSYNYQDPETGTVIPQHFRIENMGPEGFTIETIDEELVTQPSIAAIVASQSHILGAPVTDMPFSLPAPAAHPTLDESASPAEAGSEATYDDSQTDTASVDTPPLEPVAFGEDGWMQRVLDWCASGDKPALVHAGEVMVAWVDNAANRTQFVARSGLSLVNRLSSAAFASDCVEAQRLAVRCLCTLAGEADNKVPIVEQALETLFAHATAGDNSSSQYAAFIFANLVLNDPALQKVLVERGCLGALNTLALVDSEYVQSNVAWVYGNLAQHEANKKLMLMTSLQPLFHLTTVDSERVKKYAYDALACLGVVDTDDMGKLVAQVKHSLEARPAWEIEYDALEDLQLVDSGGYGNVYLGRYLHMDVAVKRLKKSQLRDLEAFKVEIGMMAKLRHPNIVLFLGATTSPLAIVTEYMSRKSLFDVIHDSRCLLDSRLVLNMIKDAALGMAYLHSLRIIHRDFKSLNLLVDHSFNVKITDFGLSRVLTSDSTRTPHGTYAWRPPEMFRSESYDRKVDVYSYGIVLWELLTRRIPFEGMSYEAIKKLVLSGVRPEVPATEDMILVEVVDLMVTCWAGDPKLRPDFSDVCEGLNELQGLV